MKVLFCTNVFQKVSNGPAKFAHLLLSESENCGFELHVLTEDIYSEIPAVHKLNLNIPQKLQLISQFIRMWRYHKAAMALHKQYQFDVIVYNNAFVGLISSMLFKPTVGMINDDNNAVKSFRSIWLKYAIFHQLEYLTCKRMKRIIVNSFYLENILSGQYRKEKNKFSVLYKGIENEIVEMNRQVIIKQKEPGSILFVSTNVGGIPEAINGNRFAWLVDSGNAFQLKEALAGAFTTSIEDDLVNIDEHLNNFKSSLVATRFKMILEEC